VKVQWAKDGVTGHKDEFFHKKPEDVTDYSTKVAFDFVATRDIAEGEEILLDYGDAWEKEWNRLDTEWQGFDRSHLDAYQSATEYNDLYADAVLFTSLELEWDNPHPNNLSIRCHYLLEQVEGAFDGDESFFYNWFRWDGDNTGIECEILERQGDVPSYVVQIPLGNEDGSPKIVSNIPRVAIKFFDKPYTTDFHMIGAFRHTLGIPDKMLPDAWRRPNDESSGGFGDGSDTIDDACERNPYREQNEHAAANEPHWNRSRIRGRFRSFVRG